MKHYIYVISLTVGMLLAAFISYKYVYGSQLSSAMETVQRGPKCPETCTCGPDCGCGPCKC